MRHPIAPNGDFIGAMGIAVLSVALPDASPESIVEAGRRAASSVAAMPDVTLAGVAVAAGVARVQLAAMGGRDFVGLPRERRAELTARLGECPLPLVRTLLQLVRGLALVAYFEGATR